MKGACTAVQNDSPFSVIRWTRSLAMSAGSLASPDAALPSAATGGSSTLLRQVAGLDLFTRRAHGKALHDVLQLAHVARPSIRHQ